MWIVRLALSRPRTIAVLALLIVILGVLSITRMPTDIFPVINLPVISVVWSYNGLSPEEMEGRVLRVSENANSTTVGNIEHIDSQALSGVGVVIVYFQPADISAQVLDFGAPAPIDIRISGPYPNQPANYALAQQIRDQAARVPGVVDCTLYQVRQAPELRVNVDRVKALQLGLTQQQGAGNVLVSLASSSLVSPSFFLDPRNGVQYSVSVQTPQYRIDSVEALMRTPVGGTGSSTGGSQGQAVAQGQSASTGPSTPQLLANVAAVSRDTTPVVVNHTNVMPVFDVYASVESRDLGSAAADIQRILNRLRKQTPRGSTVTMGGQVQTMRSSFGQMAFGLIFAVLLIYLLLTVNFESWVAPLVILMASPGALCGVV
jgi:multidrug efflux pump subunit AcrB